MIRLWQRATQSVIRTRRPRVNYDLTEPALAVTLHAHALLSWMHGHMIIIIIGDIREVGGVFGTQRVAVLATLFVPLVETCARAGSARMSMVGLLGPHFNCTVNAYDVLGRESRSR